MCSSSNLYLSLSGQQQNIERPSCAMKVMAGKGLRLNVAHTLPPPKHRGRQSVLCGEIWPESITDFLSWERKGQRRDPGSVLMVGSGDCWVLPELSVLEKGVLKGEVKVISRDTKKKKVRASWQPGKENWPHC